MSSAKVVLTDQVFVAKPNQTPAWRRRAPSPLASQPTKSVRWSFRCASALHAPNSELPSFVGIQSVSLALTALKHAHVPCPAPDSQRPHKITHVEASEARSLRPGSLSAQERATRRSEPPWARQDTSETLHGRSVARAGVLLHRADRQARGAGTAGCHVTRTEEEIEAMLAAEEASMVALWGSSTPCAPAEAGLNAQL